MDQASLNLLLGARVVFFDFDGVIKESLEVKADAFEYLFRPYGLDVSERVRKHHEANGGMSRFEKLPIYLEWAGLERNLDTLNSFEHRFSLLVKSGVIDSPWVLGMPDYLRKNVRRQTFYLVTATPENEIKHILYALKIDHFFSGVMGSPETKKDSIRKTVIEHKIDVVESVLVGDSRLDYDAAIENCINFILRKTKFNIGLENAVVGGVIGDFRY